LIWSPHFKECSPSVLFWNVQFFSLSGNFMKHFLFKLLLVSTSLWTCHNNKVERPITKHKPVNEHPSNVVVGLCANGSKHIIRNQKGHQMYRKRQEKFKESYVLIQYQSNSNINHFHTFDSSFLPKSVHVNTKVFFSLISFFQSFDTENLVYHSKRK